MNGISGKRWSLTDRIRARISGIPDQPLLLEIEPTHGCNLRCIMCHVPTQVDTKPVYLDIDVLERSLDEIHDCHLIVGSEYEPTIHPQFEKLLRLIIRKGWKLDFLTNGVNLHRIDEGLWADVPFHVFNASFDGATVQPFSKVRVGANYNSVKKNILRIAEIARKNGACTAINATLLRTTLHETSDLVRMWDADNFDLVRLLIMQARDTRSHVLEESLYFRRPELVAALNNVAQTVLEGKLRIGVRCGYFGSTDFAPPVGLQVAQGTIHSDNPDYRPVPSARQDLQLGPGPGMTFPCKSPFVYCRIRWDGIVDLCNKRDFAIGNIYDASLHSIWLGHQANVRRRKIRSSPSNCKQCDYFRFCIDSQHQDLMRKESHFADGILKSPDLIGLQERLK